MLKRLRIAIERTLIFAYDVLEYVRDVWAVRIRRRHRTVLRETAGARAQLQLGSRVAIVALYPTDESLPFTKNLLRILHSNGFFVLAISTRKLPESIQANILTDCHHLIERAGVGRDFGSYKMGLNWLEKKSPGLNGIEILVLANDSLFYPAAFDRELKEMINHPANWQCLFENYENHYHAQSFFLLFRRPAFLSTAFQKFWKKYQPYSSRRHSINCGEVRLSTCMRRAGHIATARFDSTRIVSALLNKNPRLEISKIAELSPASNDAHISRSTIFDSAIKTSTQGAITKKDKIKATHAQEPISATSKNASDHSDELIQTIELHKWAYLISHRCEYSNPTHALALLANNLLMSPIKRDICYRGFFDISQILNLSIGYNYLERTSMALDLNKRGIPASLTGIRSLLWRVGRL